MTWLNLLALALIALLMKGTVLLLPRAGAGAKSVAFLASPVLAPSSLGRSRPLRALPRALLRGGGCLAALVFYCWLWHRFDAFHLRGPLLGYLVAPAVLLTTEAFLAVITILWLPGGRLLPVLHCNPLGARSVAEFWGRRWNLWMSDWFREVIFLPLRRRPVFAVWLIFFLSGLLHEWVLNTALWLVTGRNLFGTMMIYFLLQAAGVLLERRFQDGPGKVLFAWLVVLGPAPLVFNESMLRTLHLWPGP